MPAPFSISHPYVQAYLEHARTNMLESEDNAHELGLASECVDKRWHVLSNRAQSASWWRVEYGGVARPEGVASALAAGLHLNDRPERALSIYDAERIFAVAALAVYPFPTHPAHWAFWAKNSKQRVAEVVHEVVCEKPQRVVLPANVAWIDVEYNLLCLRTYQKGWLPLSPRPVGEHSAKVAAKKRTAPAKTRTSARRGKKAVAVYVAVVESPTPTTNMNGKRTAATEEDAIVVGELPPKKQKRGMKALTSSTGKTRNVAPDAPTTGNKRTRALSTMEPTENISPSRLTIRITPQVKVGLPPAPSAQTKRTSSNDSLDLGFSLSPLSSPPRTPSHVAFSGSSPGPESPTPKRPAGRCLNFRGSSEATSDSANSETSVAPSATLTAVASAAMSSDAGSTRAGTPMNNDVMSEKPGKRVKDAWRGAFSRVPERTSIRIKARRSGTSPGSSSGSSDSRLALRRAEKKRKV
ncbi:hypothetical protein BC628DRAFT_476690 [Trametes gibbosa]|nr:hypothetical protein BC628DRAFT_476690 [Trametes gibbosa]